MRDRRPARETLGVFHHVGTRRTRCAIGIGLLGDAFEMCIRDSISPIDHWIAFILLAFIGGKMPVSYTHLDVYKRQMSHLFRKTTM